jgi:pyrroloquinoline-quinone synthase
MEFGELTVADVAAHGDVISAAHAISRAYDFREHPYFLWTWSADTTQVAFRRSQAPFIYAVEYFSQAVAAVLARVPSVRERLATVFDNVREEHGGGAYERCHRATFTTYLKMLGLSDEEIEQPCPPRLLAFTEGLRNFCLVHPAEQGAALLGIIEHLYVGISRQLLDVIAARAWGDIGAQNHYTAHEELDVRHAHDLFELCRAGWGVPGRWQDIAAAMLLGAHYFWTLYLDLQPDRIVRVPSRLDLPASAVGVVTV